MPRRTSRGSARTALSRFKILFEIPSFVTIAAFLFTGSLIEVVLDLLPNWQSEVIWLAASGALALFAFSRWNRNVTRTLTADHLGQSGNDRLASRRGLVVIIGLNSQHEDSDVAKLLAAAHSVEFIALIGTPETQQRSVAADIIEKLAPSLGRYIPRTHVRIFEQGNNAESVADIEQDTADAIRWMQRQGLSAEEIVVDTSDGRRAMGYGALIAAEEANVEAQYLSQKWNAAVNQPIAGAQMFKVVRDRHAAPAA